jgi:hypothetical protein
VQLEPLSLPIGGVEGGVQSAAGVHDQQIAGRNPSRQLVEPCVFDGVMPEIRHE